MEGALLQNLEFANERDRVEAPSSGEKNQKNQHEKNFPTVAEGNIRVSDIVVAVF
jgi:hypothetical protein